MGVPLGIGNFYLVITNKVIYYNIIPTYKTNRNLIWFKIKDWIPHLFTALRAMCLYNTGSISFLYCDRKSLIKIKQLLFPRHRQCCELPSNVIWQTFYMTTSKCSSFPLKTNQSNIPMSCHKLTLCYLTFFESHILVFFLPYDSFSSLHGD